jgi:hypothetical protein
LLAAVLFLVAASAAQADLIVGVTATASSFYSGTSLGPPIALVNGSGFSGVAPNWADVDSDGVPEHGNEWRNKMWMSAAGTNINEQWVEFALPASEGVDFMRVWNFNQIGDTSAEPNKWERGVQNAVVEWRPDALSPWVTLNGGNPFTFTPGTGLLDYDNVTDIKFAGAPARFVRILVQNNWAGKTGAGYVGLSEVEFVAPEPGSLAVLAMGGLALLRRKLRR